MRIGLISTFIMTFFLASPVYATNAQTQSHLNTLLGELLHLEQQLETPKIGVDSIKPGGNYRIKPGDSLGAIAYRAYGQTNIKLDLVMELIVKQNPNAFFRNNANFIYADKVITIPSIGDFRAMLFTANTKSFLNDTSDKSHWIRFP
jgi:phage tail protein X